MAATWLYAGTGLLILALFLAERRWESAVTRLEENILATLLALITIISFVQVVMRYGFNTTFGGALELTRIIFAWLILFGMSYGVKMGSHLGVDAFIRMLPGKGLRYVAIFGAAATLLYAVMLISVDWMKIFGVTSKGGAVVYWSKMYQLQLGLEDLKYPTWISEPLGLEERVKRWMAYLILPVGLGLLAFRSLQAMIQIIRGERELIIAGHEAEDLVAENKDVLKGEQA
ncbi:TRAP transporter small permease [Maritalea porphyrae]|jgi:C4-dicarboxylate transporter DctQ subunit|uniref:TRAP transporter small permease n=1 Tax=Maritalea porphyrae TaxID=880732 RepID=UPI0022AF9E5B|nr:TRAP transporter small permease [Maritalea porphyrae]MCZ4271976.1 TRAP transporter small permease [Maritalea porphyrae]